MTSDIFEDDFDDFWDCKTCHDDNMDSTVSSQIAFYNILGKDMKSQVSDKVNVCAQCHNGIVVYQDLIDENTDLEDFNPYRYGKDPDGLLRAFKEDGANPEIDEATGIATYMAIHSYVENFSGSVHESMGLSCTDCHMPETTSKDGKTYTAHNASGSPLMNEVALEKCLTCHGQQDGIDTTTGMFYYVRQKQTDVATAKGVAQDKLGTLYDAILARVESGDSAHKVALEKAKDMYTTADFYLEWAAMPHVAVGTLPADGRGASAPHNYTGMLSYFARAGAVADEALALLDSE
jgi:nitrite reductase (cytochrome c-552)